MVGYGVAQTYPSEAFSWSENIGENRMALEYGEQASLDLWLNGSTLCFANIGFSPFLEADTEHAG